MGLGSERLGRLRVRVYLLWVCPVRRSFFFHAKLSSASEPGKDRRASLRKQLLVAEETKLGKPFSRKGSSQAGNGAGEDQRGR